MRTEGGVPRGEEADGAPKNFHLSERAGESDGNSESDSVRAASYGQRRASEIPSAAAGGAKTTADRGSARHILIMSWTEDKKKKKS